MIGAMPAVAVRHERRRQEKRGGSGGSGHSVHHQVGLSSRPSQLYVGGVWPPPHSPCSTSPSPGGHHSPDDDRLPEYYVCGKVSALQLVVGSLLLGAIVLIVGLVQLTPGADAADHRFYLMGAGLALIIIGLALTAIRCYCLHCSRKSVVGQIGEGELVAQEHPISSIDMLVKKNSIADVETGDGIVGGSTSSEVITSPSELDVLIKNHHHRHSHPTHNYNNHNVHRGSNGSAIHYHHCNHNKSFDSNEDHSTPNRKTPRHKIGSTSSDA